MEQSDKWVMEPEERIEAEKGLMTMFGAWLQDRKIFVSASSDEHGAYVQVLVKNESRTFHYPIEARVNMRDIKSSPREVSLLALDYISAYLEEFFKEDESVFLPIDWADFEVEGLIMQLRGQVQNLLMEDLANQILTGGEVAEDDVKGLKLNQYG